MASRFTSLLRGSLAAVTLGVRPTASTAASSTPTISSGSGAPTASEPNGSIYLRTDGAAATTIYVRAAGAWTANGVT
jgi:hypothetical protein